MVDPYKAMRNTIRPRNQFKQRIPSLPELIDARTRAGVPVGGFPWKDGKVRLSVDEVKILKFIALIHPCTEKILNKFKPLIEVKSGLGPDAFDDGCPE